MRICIHVSFFTSMVAGTLFFYTHHCLIFKLPLYTNLSFIFSGRDSSVNCNSNFLAICFPTLRSLVQNPNLELYTCI